MRSSVLAAVALASAALGLGAQPPLVVAGRVVRATAVGELPLAGVTVTLHRIGAGSAGPVDSTTAAAGGTYRFRVATPDTTAMYLATARHGGIAYFAPPVRPGDITGDGEIHVFDTTSAPIRLRVGGRHVVVSAPDADGQREVLDVYELQNDTVLTRLASRARPAFVVELPARATNARARQGDFTGEALVIEGRTASVVAPVAPGIRQLALAYTLPPDAFPLSLRVDDSTDVLEVLLEEPAAHASADSLKAQAAVTSEGRSFARFLARSLPAGKRLEITVPAAPVQAPGWIWLVVLGAASLGAVAWSLRPRWRAPASPAAPAPASRTRELSLAIAGVDALLADPATAPASHESLRAYRAQLQRELDGLLAAAPRAD
jgi:hypothetical protein